MAVMFPGAAAAACVNMASEMSKWLFECDPHVNPQSLHICATRTDPCIVKSEDRRAECRLIVRKSHAPFAANRWQSYW